MTTSDRYVYLRGGLTVPVAALRLAWNLEARGLNMAINGEFLSVGPRHRLTDDDRALIRQWKSHLLAIVAYTAPTV